MLVEGEQTDAWQWIGSSSLLTPDKRKRADSNTPREDTLPRSPIQVEQVHQTSLSTGSYYPKL